MDEYNRILNDKMREGVSNLIRERYLTFAVGAPNVDAAVPKLARMRNDCMQTLARIRSDATVVRGEERLDAIHSQLRPGKKLTSPVFEELSCRSGLRTKDLIAPGVLDFKPQGRADCFYSDGMYGQVLGFRRFGSELSDRALADIIDLALPLKVTLHIQAMDKAKAAAYVKQRLAWMDKEIIDERMTAVKKGSSKFCPQSSSTPKKRPRICSTFNVNWEYELTAGKDGTASLPYMPHGTFEVEEIEAPAGYFMPTDAQPVAFRVDNPGFIGLDIEDAQFSDMLELTFENTPTILDISKTDAVTGKELPGATLVITDSDGSVVEEWISTDTAHRIVGIEPGDYVLTETIALEGYLVATSVEFTVAPTGEVQRVETKDDYTKVDISKTDIAIGDELPGAHLQVIDKGNKVVGRMGYRRQGSSHQRP